MIATIWHLLQILEQPVSDPELPPTNYNLLPALKLHLEGDCRSEMKIGKGINFYWQEMETSS